MLNDRKNGIQAFKLSTIMKFHFSQKQINYLNRGTQKSQY